jgi:hypothetical protein
MFCVNCGGGPLYRAPGSGRVKLRATGDPDEPFMVVCERCGRDIVTSRNLPSERLQSRLTQFGLDPDGPGLFSPPRRA